MERVNQHYRRLGILAFLVLFVLVFVQVMWMQKAVDLQFKEQHLQLQQKVSEIALGVKSGFPDIQNQPENYLTTDKIREIKKDIDELFEKEGLTLRPDFAIYSESDSVFFVSSSEMHRQELMASEIRSCLSCIISFTITDGIEQKENESNEDFMNRVMQGAQHQYFSPVSSIASVNPNKTIYWLSLYQAHSIWGAIRGQTFLFLSSVLLLSVLIFLFYFLLTAFARHKKNSEAKNQFFNSMTHEFKTPLASIRLASVVLQQSNDEKKKANYHSLIKRESLALESQIDKLLEYSLLDNKEIQLEQLPININQCIRTAIQRLKPQVEFHRAELSQDLSDNIPSILGDTGHLSNCISNIVENSLKYSQNGVKIWVKSESGPRGATIYIQDYGPGIEADHIDHIFDRFYRGQKGNQYKAQGFGIGLSYVKYVIEAHGGTISCDSKPGQTSFTIKLPYA